MQKRLARRVECFEVAKFAVDLSHVMATFSRSRISGVWRSLPLLREVYEMQHRRT